MATTSESMTQTARRYDIDWLRVLGMCTVFLFHNMRFFNTEPWHAKNITTAAGFDLAIGILGQWLMPLFFVLSGASIYLALNPRRVGAFLWSRVLRLGVPAVLGMLVIAPPQVYFERVTAGGYLGSLPHFYLADYFHGFYGRGGNFALTGMHLWYVCWLLVYTLILLPLFLFLRSPAGRRVTHALATVFAHRGSILALALFVPFAHVLGEALSFLWMEAGWNLLTYIVLLLLGFLIMTDERYTATLRKGWPLALGAGVVMMVAMGFVWDYGDNLSDGQYVLQWTVRGLGAWFYIVAMLGAAQRYLSFTNRFLRYANEAVLPFYILHQTVILTVGFFIRNWPMPIGIKLPLLTIVSFAIIMGLYELAIRRANVLRFLFGMRTTRRAAPAAGQPRAE